VGRRGAGTGRLARRPSVSLDPPWTEEKGPIDVLFIGCIEPAQRGGSGVLGTELLSGLAARGHRLRALVPVPPSAHAGSLRFAERHPEIRITWVPVPVRSSDLADGSRNPAYRAAEDRGIRAALPRLIEERRPDAILVGRESSVGDVPEAARVLGVPTAVIVQGGRALQKILEPAPDALARRQIESLRGADLVIAVAGHVARSLAPLALRRVAVVPNFVDLERFSPGERPAELARAHALGPRQVVVAHVSNLGPAKRPMDVVESAGRVLAANPDTVYLIVGDGPYRAPMEARCRALGVVQRVRFVGWVEHRDMPAYFRLADVVVMPSDHEGLPLVHLEAQASGKLLVASDIPGTLEVVVDGRTGLVCRRGDVADLAAKTLRGAGDGALRGAIGRAARTAVGAHARPSAVGAYARLLEALAADAPAARRIPAVGRPQASGPLPELLGPDLWALVEAQGGRLVAATPIGTLPSPLRARAAFRLRLDDGRVMKGRRLDAVSSAARLERLSGLLDPRHFPRVLGRRGAALLSEWAEGEPGAGEDPEICRQAGALQGALHGVPVSPEDRRAAQARRERWAERLDRDLSRLVDRRALDGATAARAIVEATAAAPAGADLGLVHGDLCLENIVLHRGEIRVVDTEALRVDACDHDLARTWYRWPMTAAGRRAYEEGYRERRSPRAFAEHFLHWAVIVLVESAAFRVRSGAGDARLPVARLRALLASRPAPAAAGSEGVAAARLPGP
jgi:phosphatidylinositol alpha-1,6-mannosyltransferase